MLERVPQGERVEPPRLRAAPAGRQGAKCAMSIRIGYQDIINVLFACLAEIGLLQTLAFLAANALLHSSRNP